MLSLFDQAKPTNVCDASRGGIDAPLLKCHNDTLKRVVDASRALTETQQRYSQIENRHCKWCLFVKGFITLSTVASLLL